MVFLCKTSPSFIFFRLAAFILFSIAGSFSAVFKLILLFCEDKFGQSACGSQSAFEKEKSLILLEWNWFFPLRF